MLSNIEAARDIQAAEWPNATPSAPVNGASRQASPQTRSDGQPMPAVIGQHQGLGWVDSAISAGHPKLPSAGKGMGLDLALQAALLNDSACAAALDSSLSRITHNGRSRDRLYADKIAAIEKQIERSKSYSGFFGFLKRIIDAVFGFLKMLLGIVIAPLTVMTGGAAGLLSISLFKTGLTSILEFIDQCDRAVGGVGVNTKLAEDGLCKILQAFGVKEDVAKAFFACTDVAAMPFTPAWISEAPARMGAAVETTLKAAGVDDATAKWVTLGVTMAITVLSTAVMLAVNVASGGSNTSTMATQIKGLAMAIQGLIAVGDGVEQIHNGVVDIQIAKLASAVVRLSAALLLFQDLLEQSIDDAKEFMALMVDGAEVATSMMDRQHQTNAELVQAL